MSAAPDADGDHPGPDDPDPAAGAQPDARTAGPLLSGYGVASTALALLGVVAAVLVMLMARGHDEHVAAVDYQTRVARTAADWTATLINLTPDNVDASLAALRDGTVGELNNGFESAVAPFAGVVRQLGARTRGQVNAVAVETLHRDLDGRPVRPRPADVPVPGRTRTDTVMVVATSVSENPAAPQPRTVNWRLRLAVSDVAGSLRISQLELFG